MSSTGKCTTNGQNPDNQRDGKSNPTNFANNMANDDGAEKSRVSDANGAEMGITIEGKERKSVDKEVVENIEAIKKRSAETDDTVIFNDPKKEKNGPFT